MVQVYFILRVYCAHIERILVLRVLAVRAVLTDEILPALAVPAVQDPEILGSAGSIHSNEPTTDSGSIRRTYRTPKKCEYSQYPQQINLKYCYLIVHKVFSAVFLLENTLLTPTGTGSICAILNLNYSHRNWEHLCNLEP